MTELDRLVFLDVETFGLNTQEDFIIELGFKITDLELNVIDDFQTVIWDSPTFDARFRMLEASTNEESKFVLEMHEKSGLWNEAQAEGATKIEAGVEALHWLTGHGITKEEPLCGSSVQFDREMLREQYPAVHDLFSYRNIDTSTIKELCRRYNPRIYSLLDVMCKPQKLHRVLPDLDDTIAEMGFYSDNFLWTE